MPKDADEDLMIIPGGEASLAIALKSYMAQKHPDAKYQAFRSVLTALRLYWIEQEENGDILNWISEKTREYSDNLNKFIYFWRIGAPIAVVYAGKLDSIIMEVEDMNVIPPYILRQAIVVAAKKEEVIEVVGNDLIGER
ncbi:MAG: hypothetical protein QXP84_07480 [Candidatus Korarchaeum sp.]